MLTWIILAILAVNAATFVSFWRDKVYAINDTRRIPEADLLKLALIGGTPGAFLARHMFRHKTRKEPFSTYLQLIAVIQLGGLIGISNASNVASYDIDNIFKINHPRSAF